MSDTTPSKGSRPSASSASTPFAVTTTELPSPSSCARRTRWLIGLSSTMSNFIDFCRSPASLEVARDVVDETARVDRLRYVATAAGGERSLVVAFHRVRGQRDDRQV